MTLTLFRRAGFVTLLLVATFAGAGIEPTR